MLLILEDLHWADASTRDLLTFLSRMLHRERVASSAPTAPTTCTAVTRCGPVVADLQRLPSVTSVSCGHCLPPSSRNIFRSCGTCRGGRSPAATLNRIVERAEGNAYYAEELLAAAGDAAGLPAAPLRPGGAAAVPG